MAAAYLQTRPSKRSKKMEDDHARAGHFYICDILSFTYCHHSTNLTVFPRWPTSLFDFSSFKKLNNPQLKEFNKKKIEPRKHIKEHRLENAENLIEIGTEINPSFQVGDKVCVQSKSTGKGFAGAMKRHNFSGMRASHGVSISHRAHGSTGQNQNPGKVFKGKKMAGHLGDEVTTTKNLEVLLVDTDKKLIFLKGSVPGKNKSVVRVYK